MPYSEPPVFRWVRFKIVGQSGWTPWEPGEIGATGIMLIGDDMPWPLKPLGRTEPGSLEDIEIGSLIIAPRDSTS